MSETKRQPTVYKHPDIREFNVSAIVALALAIIYLLSSGFFLLLIGVIIFGHRALLQMRIDPYTRGKVMAIIALTVAYVSLGLTVISILANYFILS